VLCFQQKNLTLQTVQHPNVIPFYGLYEDQGKSFLIEKLIEGPVLAQILRQRGGRPMPPEEALIYLKGLATALEYMHGFGLVHSTIDPINVQVARDGTVMLGNFGFARFIDKPMTKTGISGLPLCMAPEQLRGERVYPNTDIYALGILFYEFVAGSHPFLGTSSSAATFDQASADRLRDAHLGQQPPDLNQLNPSLPSGLTQTVLTALSKDPKLRYQSAQEMLEMCSAVLGSSPTQVPNRIGGRDAQPPTQVVAPGVPPPATSTASNMPYAAVAATAAAQYGEVPGRTGTQVIPEPARQAVQPGYAPPPSPPPQSYYLPEQEKPRRPAWLIPVIALLLFGFLLCGAAGVWAGLPILQELFGSPTSTPTLTATLTETPTATIPAPTDLPLPPTLPPAPTEPVVIPPTQPPPPPTLAPTEPPPPSPTPQKTAFKVTIRNNESYPIYAFRDGTLMGSDPIPPGKYIWYLNIPAGLHNFRFCLDMSQGQCPYEKQVMVDQDITINVP
jgi:serine/threonine-protein kinase